MGVLARFRSCADGGSWGSAGPAGTAGVKTGGVESWGQLAVGGGQETTDSVFASLWVRSAFLGVAAPRRMRSRSVRGMRLR
jgi:hypothetical protein